MVATTDLGSVASRRGGSSPFIRTSDCIRQSLFLCHIVPNHRTFIDDYLKILDFIDWLKVAYPEKAKFLTENLTLISGYNAPFYIQMVITKNAIEI